MIKYIISSVQIHKHILSLLSAVIHVKNNKNTADNYWASRKNNKRIVRSGSKLTTILFHRSINPRITTIEVELYKANKTGSTLSAKLSVKDCVTNKVSRFISYAFAEILKPDNLLRILIR